MSVLVVIIHFTSFCSLTKGLSVQAWDVDLIRLRRHLWGTESLKMVSMLRA